MAITAAAQSTYIGATGFADVRQFGSTKNVPFYQDDFSLDKTGGGGGLRIGTFVHPRWSIELSADVGTKATAEFEDPVQILIFPPPPPRVMKSSTSFTTVSTLIGFHPPNVGRVRLGYLAGFSFVRGTYKTDFPSYILPAGGFTWSSVLTGTLGRELSSLGFTSLPPPRFTSFATTQKHNTGALTLGFEAAMAVTTSFSVVPEVRAHVFSGPNNGPGVFLIRPGLSARWTF